jgi:hypothetical protein
MFSILARVQSRSNLFWLLSENNFIFLFFKFTNFGVDFLFLGRTISDRAIEAS